MARQELFILVHVAQRGIRGKSEVVLSYGRGGGSGLKKVVVLLLGGFFLKFTAEMIHCFPGRQFVRNQKYKEITGFGVFIIFIFIIILK